jgi:hypothetical protein
MRLVISIVFVILFADPSAGQKYPDVKFINSPNLPDTLAFNTYSRLMSHDYDLINGREYIYYAKHNQSNPFFKSATLATGEIYFKKRIYYDFNLLYDIYKDQLVINYLNPSGYLNLVCQDKHFVDSFAIRINNEITWFHTLYFPSGSTMKDGYYEVGFRGKTILLIKHLKSLSTINGKDEYLYNKIRYLRMNGNYFQVKSLSGFCKLFGERKSEMRKFIRSMQLTSFRRITDADLISILRYNETL